MCIIGLEMERPRIRKGKKEKKKERKKEIDTMYYKSAIQSLGSIKSTIYFVLFFIYFTSGIERKLLVWTP